MCGWGGQPTTTANGDAKDAPPSPYLASGSRDRTIKIWCVSTFTCLKTLEGHGNSVLKVFPFNFGTELMSAGSDGLVKVWHVKSSTCLASLDEHQDKVRGAPCTRCPGA